MIFKKPNSPVFIVSLIAFILLNVSLKGQHILLNDEQPDAECYLHIFAEVKSPSSSGSAGLLLRMSAEGRSSEGLEIILLNEDMLPIRSLAADASGTVIFKGLDCLDKYFIATAGDRSLEVSEVLWVPEWGFDSAPVSLQQEFSEEGLQEISVRLKAIDLTTGKSLIGLEFQLDQDGSVLKKQYTEEDGSLVFEHLQTDKTYRISTKEQLPEIIIINLFDQKLTPLKRGTI
jgi:hypothetical protein